MRVAANLFARLSLALFAALMAYASVASAGVVTINFPEDVVLLPPGLGYQYGPSWCNCNVTADGFRVSPNHGIDLLGPPYDTFSTGGFRAPTLGIDLDFLPNPNYLGPTPILPNGTMLYIDNNGKPFSLLGVTLASIFGNGGMELRTSNGLDIIEPILGDSTEISFSGSPRLLTDIDWVTFAYLGTGAPVEGIQQLVLSVPEPGSLGMFGVGLLGFFAVGATRRRSRR